MGEVTLLIAPPRAGKTTALLSYARAYPTVGGWVCPDVSTWRMLVEFPGENWRIFQSEKQDNTTHIGRFYFLNEVIKAQQNRIKALQFQPQPACSTWIIDEVGPLEMREQLGWTTTLEELFQLDQQGQLNFDLLIVVRMGYETAFQLRWPFSILRLESLESFQNRHVELEKPKTFPPITGLVLAGGQSLRMGQNKALLRWEGHPLYRRTALLMAPSCKAVYLSVNPAVMTDYPDWPCLYDDLSLRNEGPLTALISAWQNLPLANWLVLSCDYPTITATSIRELVQQWDGESPMALRSEDGRPNPLMALYPANLFPAMKVFFRNGGRSLRIFLEQHQIKLIELEHPPVSVDSPQQWYELTGQQLPHRPL